MVKVKRSPNKQIKILIILDSWYIHMVTIGRQGLHFSQIIPLQNHDNPIWFLKTRLCVCLKIYMHDEDGKSQKHKSRFH